MKALFTRATEKLESAKSKTKAKLKAVGSKTKATLKAAGSKTKGTLKKVVTPLIPSYEVICTNYHLIPGQPLMKNHSRHSFEGFESKKANEFYDKVVSSEYTKMMAPIEVHMKRAGFTLRKTQIGAVEELKKFKINLN